MLGAIGGVTVVAMLLVRDPRFIVPLTMLYMAVAVAYTGGFL